MSSPEKDPDGSDGELEVLQPGEFEPLEALEVTEEVEISGTGHSTDKDQFRVRMTSGRPVNPDKGAVAPEVIEVVGTFVDSRPDKDVFDAGVWSDDFAEDVGAEEKPVLPPGIVSRVPASAQVPEQPQVFSIAPARRSTARKLAIALGGSIGTGIATIGAVSAVMAMLGKNQEDSLLDLATSDNTEDPAPEPDCVGADETPATLYAQVENNVLSREEVSSLSEKEITRLSAHTTNELVSDHFAGARKWQDLKGEWKNGSLTLVVDKLETWGGYDAVLDSLAASPTPLTTIDEALLWVASDNNLDSPSDPNNSDQTALALAKQIAMIQDARIAADPTAPQGHVDELAPDEVELAVSENIQTPPPVPALFDYPSLTPEQAEALYEAPEPMNVAKLVELKETDLEEIVAEPEWEASDPFAVPEPSFVKPKSIETPDFNEVEKAFFAQGEAELAQTPAPEPAKTFTEKAKETVKGWASKVSRWFS